jgi:hypothetical protein
MSLGGDFSAFHRNKKGRRSPTSADSSIDFRFRNAEKWFDERRATRLTTVASNASKPPVVSNRSPPPGLKRGSKDVDFWDYNELCIPSYDKFEYNEMGVEEQTVNLLPDWWHTAKWNDYVNELCSEWFQMPPDIEEGECIDASIDLPVLIYQSGQSAIDSLPFVDLLQQGFYMDIFQQYYHMFMITNSIYKN